MLGTGLNSYINAQGFPRIGMMTTVLGAVINIALDPVFIFSLNMGVRGAALATVISQGVSAAWVLRFLTGKKALQKLRLSRIHIQRERTGRILSLGFPGFVMQATNSLVNIVCNTQLQSWGGDLYVEIMTVLNSVREMTSLPAQGITAGSQPVLGFNYGARRGERVKEGIRFAAALGTGYTLITWILVMLFPKQLIGIFSEEPETIAVGARMLNIYFFGFVFMAFQFSGQTTFQALGKARYAIFFSLLRKVIIVVPLTLALPAMGFGVRGVFLAEPISNLIGGLACFLTMWRVVYRRL
jgi:putative MATE family efflux protein